MVITGSGTDTLNTVFRTCLLLCLCSRMASGECVQKEDPKAPETVVLDRGNGTSCTVSLLGATVISWKVGGEEQFFLSKTACYEEGTSIRGGVPLAFPHFGLWDSGPIHGFAMYHPWKLETPPHKSEDGSVHAEFSLSESETTRKYWDHGFLVKYQVILHEKELHFKIRVINTQESPIEFNFLFHNYFLVSRINETKIIGLQGSEYADKVQDFKKFNETREVVLIDKFTDNVYTTIKTVQQLQDKKRTLEVKKYNLPQTVVWNPWTDTIGDFTDLESTDYQNFVCIEPGNVDGYTKLNPGEDFETAQILHVL